MRITTKAHYGVTALLDLALLDDEGPISLPDIAARQGISLSYLEQLFSRLRKGGLVESSRGRAGGYRLGRTPEKISVAMVIDAMDESVDTTRCHGRADCQQGEICLTHHLWTDLSDHIYNFLDSISLADLMARKDLIGTVAAEDRPEDGDRDPLVDLEDSVQVEDSLPVDEYSTTKRLVTG